MYTVYTHIHTYISHFPTLLGMLCVFSWPKTMRKDSVSKEMQLTAQPRPTQLMSQCWGVKQGEDRDSRQSQVP